jgi:hypothetical protein
MIGPKLRLPHRPVVCHTLRADRMSYINTSYDRFYFVGPSNDQFGRVNSADVSYL